MTFIDFVYIKYKLEDIPKYYINSLIKEVFIQNDDIYLHILDSIHYYSLKEKNFDLYNKIYERSKEHYEKYINKLDLNNLPIIFLEYNVTISKYVLINGKHNFSIILFNNYLNINNLYNNCNIIYPKIIIDKIENKIKETTKRTFYNGWNNSRYQLSGYHSLNIHNININGQRRPKLRIKQITNYYDFENKIVLDLGCNIGGMLLHLPKIKKGIGIDFDELCIKCGNYITDILKFNDLSFYKYDLNNFLIKEFINSLNIEKIDIIFLLSLGSWIKNWKKLYIDCIYYSNYILLETNNDIEGKEQLELFDKFNCNINMISENSYDDQTNNYGRKLFLIKTNN
jgi:SAM-dependent methyltransferase